MAEGISIFLLGKRAPALNSSNYQDILKNDDKNWEYNTKQVDTSSPTDLSDFFFFFNYSSVNNITEILLLSWEQILSFFALS